MTLVDCGVKRYKNPNPQLRGLGLISNQKQYDFGAIASLRYLIINKIKLGRYHSTSCSVQPPIITLELSCIVGDHCNALNNNPIVVSFRNGRINYYRGERCDLFEVIKKA